MQFKVLVLKERGITHVDGWGTFMFGTCGRRGHWRESSGKTKKMYKNTKLK
jgi:hypothetical protein